MTLDIEGLADAIAAKYARGTMTPPAGSPTLIAIRQGMATARLPSKVASTPALFIIPESGSLDVGGQDRVGAHTWRALFLYAVTKDYPRETRAVNRWLKVLLDAHLSGNQLAGAFAGVLAEVKTVGYNGPGTITWADGTVFTGAELELSVITTEAWSPTA